MEVALKRLLVAALVLAGAACGSAGPDEFTTKVYRVDGERAMLCLVDDFGTLMPESCVAFGP
jgi:hypothetical protein